MKTYTVTVTFAGYISCEETYEIDACSREEAEEMALEEARDSLEVIDVEEDDEEGE